MGGVLEEHFEHLGTKLIEYSKQLNLPKNVDIKGSVRSPSKFTG